MEMPHKELKNKKQFKVRTDLKAGDACTDWCSRTYAWNDPSRYGCYLGCQFNSTTPETE